MSDATGMLQHCDRHRPRPPPRLLPRRQRPRADADERAPTGSTPAERAALAQVYASFIQHAWNPEVGACSATSCASTRTWCEDLGSRGFQRPRAVGAGPDDRACAAIRDLRDWARALVRYRAAALRRARLAARDRLRHAGRCAPCCAREPDHGASRELLRARRRRSSPPARRRAAARLGLVRGGARL